LDGGFGPELSPYAPKWARDLAQIETHTLAIACEAPFEQNRRDEGQSAVDRDLFDQPMLDQDFPVGPHNAQSSLEPTAVPEPDWGAPQSPTAVGILMRFGGAVAVAALVAAFTVGKLPSKLPVSWPTTPDAKTEGSPFGLRFAGQTAAPTQTGTVPQVLSTAIPPLAVGQNEPQGAGYASPLNVSLDNAAAGEVIVAAPEKIAAAAFVRRQLDRDEVAALLKRGEDFIASGDIASARLVLQRAAEAGEVRAALVVAGTYDPNVLEKLGLQGLPADVGMARTWYERAREFGSAEAPRRLEQLASRDNSVR